MGTRRGRHRYRENGSKLQVKEVILPERRDQNEAGSSKGIRDLYNSPYNDSDASSIKKVGEQETAAFCRLVILEKPLLEDYFQGKEKKKYKRKRVKKKLNAVKDDSIPWDLFLQTNETFQCETKSVRNISQRSLSYDENLLKRKIRNYEKQLKKEQEKNYRKQRLLEKESMEKQGNLAETWLGFLQRREELKKKNLEEHSTSNSYKRPINISLLPKKYWRDETDEKKQKSSKDEEKQKLAAEKPAKSLSALFEELKDEFMEKLVFIDDSDDDPIQF